MKNFCGKVIMYIFIFMAFSLNSNAQNDGLKSDTASLEDLMNLQLDESQIRKNMDETKVVSASKSKENVASAPGLMSVVTKQDIQAFGALTLVDVLNRVTSMYVMGSFAFPNNLATLRGDIQTQSASHVLILIDGRPCRESFYGGLDMAVYNTFPLESIERIEVIRGPGSVLYGTNAFTGVINIITRQEKKNTFQVTGKRGSFGTTGISAFQSFNQSGLQINFNGQYLNQNGWDFTATDQNYKTRTIQYGQQNIGLNLNASYKDFTLSGFYGNTNRDIFGFGRTIWDTTGNVQGYNKLNTYRGFADLGYKHKFSDRYRLTANATYNGFGDASTVALEPAKFRSNDLLIELTNFVTPVKDFNIVFGGLTNYITGSGKGQDYYHNNADIYWVKPYNDMRWAAYAQLDYRPVHYLKLIAGGQINKAPKIDMNFVPRLGAILNFTPDIGLKVLYGQAFKYAAQYERYVNIPYSRQRGDSTLKPELVSTLDVQLFIQKSTFQLSAGYFYKQQKDVVIFTDDPTIPRAQQYANLGSLTFQGVEVEGKWLPVQQLMVTGSFTYQNNIDSSGVKNNTAISNAMFKLGVAYTHNLFSIGVYNSYFSTPSANFQENSLTVNPVPQYFNMASANITGDISKIMNRYLDISTRPQFSLNLYINNLLDESIYNPEFARNFINSIPATGGRAFYINLTVKI